MKKINKKHFLPLTALFLFIALFSFGRIKDFFEVRNIEDNKYTSLARITKTVSKRMSNKVYYQYIYKGHTFSNYEEVKKDRINRYINRYYEIDFSTQKPGYSRIHLDREVTDTLKIKEAGFSIE